MPQSTGSSSRPGLLPLSLGTLFQELQHPHAAARPHPLPAGAGHDRADAVCAGHAYLLVQPLPVDRIAHQQRHSADCAGGAGVAAARLGHGGSLWGCGAGPGRPARPLALQEARTGRVAAAQHPGRPVGRHADTVAAGTGCEHGAADLWLGPSAAVWQPGHAGAVCHAAGDDAVGGAYRAEGRPAGHLCQLLSGRAVLFRLRAGRGLVAAPPPQAAGAGRMPVRAGALFRYQKRLLRAQCRYRAAVHPADPAAGGAGRPPAGGARSGAAAAAGPAGCAADPDPSGHAGRVRAGAQHAYRLSCAAPALRAERHHALSARPDCQGHA